MELLLRQLVLSRKLRMLSFLLLALTTEASQKAQIPPLPSIGKYKLNRSAVDPLPEGMADVTMRIKMPEGKSKTRLADLRFRLGNGRRTGLTNLELRRPSNPECWLKTSALSTYIYENCYSLRKRGDSMDYQSVATAFPELSNMHGATTHVCVDETSRRDDGTYARVTLSIGRVKTKGGEEAVQFKIHLALSTDKDQSTGLATASSRKVTNRKRARRPGRRKSDQLDEGEPKVSKGSLPTELETASSRQPSVAAPFEPMKKSWEGRDESMLPPKKRTWTANPH